MDEACEECTQNCITMHKKNKNPSPVATTFFKVMFGDDYSKVLVLPPRFAHTVQNEVEKSTRLEDSSGEKWDVKFTKVDGLLALGKGWNKFASAHNLKLGDLLVFHYIMESHFVVMMYGKSGCPEIRHFGISQRQTKETKQKNKLIEDDDIPLNKLREIRHFGISQRQTKETKQKNKLIEDDDIPLNKLREIRHFGISQRQTKETKQKNKLIEDDIPLNNGTNDHHYSKESSSQSEQSQQIKQQKRKFTMPENVETTHTDHIAASPSQPGTSGSEKEKSQISDQSEPLVEKANPDNMVFETHTTVKQDSMVDKDDLHLQGETRKNNLQTVVVGSDGGSKTNLADNMVSETHATVKQICPVYKDDLHLQNENRKNNLQTEAVGSDGGSKTNLADKMVSETHATVKQICSVYKDDLHLQNESMKNYLQTEVVGSDSGSKKNLANNMVSETSTTVKQIFSVEKDDLHLQDESRKNNLQPKVVGCDGSSKKNLVARDGGSDDTVKTEIWKRVEKKIAKRKESNVAQTEASNSEARASVTVEKYKESLVTPNEATYSDSLKKRLRNDDNSITPAKIQKKEPGTSAKMQENELDTLANMQKYKPDTSAKIQKNEPDTSAEWVEVMKKESTMNHGSAKASEVIKKEPSTDHGSGSKQKDNKIGLNSIQTKENENALIRVKDEPEEYAEPPQYSLTNSSFSAVMTSFKFLELPKRVKWCFRSKVVLLRNGADLWPVLFETNLGIKALTQNWELFAKAKGIKPGDKCDFVLQRSTQYQRYSCKVYNVHVTRK